MFVEKRKFLGVVDGCNHQKTEKTLDHTHTTTQKRTNNGFQNTKKHVENVFNLRS